MAATTLLYAEIGVKGESKGKMGENGVKSGLSKGKIGLK